MWFGWPTQIWESIFLWVTIAAAVLSGLGVGAAFFSAIIGYRITDETTRESRIEIAAANARTAEAELKLEQLRRQVAPRQLNREAFFKAIEGQPKARVEIMYLRDDPECFDVAQQIWRLLEDARWDVTPPVPIPSSGEQDALQRGPTSMSISGEPSGITIAVHSFSQAEVEAAWTGC
jgi:hypothetical protein